MRLAPSCLVLLIFLSAAGRASAWNGPGHMAVSKIVYEELSKEERAAAHEVLKQHPHYELYLVKNRPENVLPEEWAFLRASTWPDFVRPPLGRRKLTAEEQDKVRYNRPVDHYTDIPVFARDASPEFMARVRKRPSDHDVICAIKQRVAELRLATLAPTDRAIALCWLLHLGEDVHQPLHAGTLYTEQLFPTGDQGGNLSVVRVNGQKVKLHFYWDNLPGTAPGEYTDEAGYAPVAYKIASNVAKRVSEAHPRAGFREELKKREFKDWADESHELAEKVAYWDGRIAEVVVAAPRPKGFSATQPELPESAKEAPEGYDEKAHAVADRRLALAGYRLADVLKPLLEKK